MNNFLPSHYSNFKKPVIYDKMASEALWTALHTSSLIAEEYKYQLITKGKLLTTNLGGRPKGDSRITYVVYHVPIPKDSKVIESVDIGKKDISLADYSYILRNLILSILKISNHAEIILLTNEEFSSNFTDLPITVLNPEVDSRKPMYYRALCYNSLIQNGFLKGTVVFLDSDCVVLKDISTVIEHLNINIGVTYRYSPGYMPICEGLIIVNVEDERSRDFFAHYMGTYDFIKDNREIKSIYHSDLMCWRGGQLSLNAICPGIRNLTFMDSTDSLTLLPSDTFLYSPKEVNTIDQFNSAINGRWIIHLKGSIKLKMRLQLNNQLN